MKYKTRVVLYPDVTAQMKVAYSVFF